MANRNKSTLLLEPDSSFAILLIYILKKKQTQNILLDVYLSHVSYLTNPFTTSLDRGWFEDVWFSHVPTCTVQSIEITSHFGYKLFSGRIDCTVPLTNKNVLQLPLYSEK